MKRRDTFRCGHPRTAENSYETRQQLKDGSLVSVCLFCQRVRKIRQKVERGQARINKGKPVHPSIAKREHHAWIEQNENLGRLA